jgi:hypothetical protein
MNDSGFSSTAEPMSVIPQEASCTRHLPDAWTVIATRPRKSPGMTELTWSPVPWTAIDVETAHRLRLEGTIVMASRHERDRVELVVRPVTERRSRHASPGARRRYTASGVLHRRNLVPGCQSPSS